MASTALTLLTMPREIRDNIHSYLDRKVSLFYRISVNYTIFARAENAPLLNLQLVHSQLRHEYRSADCFRKSCVSLTLLARTPSIAEQEVDHAQFDAMISTMQHVTFVANSASTPQLSHEDAVAINDITTTYMELESLRLIIKEPLDTLRLPALVQILPVQLMNPVRYVAAPELPIDNRVFDLRACIGSLQVEDTRHLAYVGVRSNYARTCQVSRVVVYLYAIDRAEWCPNAVRDLGGRILPVNHRHIQLASLGKRTTGRAKARRADDPVA